MTADKAPTIGLLPWGNVLEDFLEPTGLTFERFCEEFTGSWMFAWARALAIAGVRTEIICISRDARDELRTTHRPSGTPILVLPTTRAYRVVDRRMAYPYGSTVRQAFAQETEPRGRRRVLMEVAREVGPYLATPPIRLTRALRRGQWRAILCQEYEDPRFDISVALGWATGVPVFGSFQGGVHQYGHVERILRPRAVRSSAGLMIGPEREYDRVRANYGMPPEKIARIVNPVDLDVWQPRDRASARAELGLPADALVVGWHGRIAIDHKGLDVLLEAWSGLAGTAAGDVRLLLIGGGSDSEALDELIARKQLPGVVRVDEHIHDATLLSSYLSAADLYVLSSRHEGFPVSIIEAMACALPIVATDVAGAGEILGAGEDAAGVVVSANDPRALAAALGELLGDRPRREELGERARARAEAGFSLEAVGSQLRDLLVGAGNA